MVKNTINWDLNLYKINSLDGISLPEPYGSTISLSGEVN
jgi:hypothetical protein